MFLSAFDCCTKMSHQRFEIDKHLFWKHVFAFRWNFCGKNAGFAKLLFSLLHRPLSSRPGPFPRLNTPKVTYIYMPQLDQTFLIPLGSVIPKIFRANIPCDGKTPLAIHHWNDNWSVREMNHSSSHEWLASQSWQMARDDPLPFHSVLKFDINLHVQIEIEQRNWCNTTSFSCQGIWISNLLLQIREIPTLHPQVLVV